MDNHPENWVSNLDVSINGGNKIGKIHARTNWTSFNFTKKKLFSKLMLQIFRIFARVITHPSSCQLPMWFHEIFITKISVIFFCIYILFFREIRITKKQLISVPFTLIDYLAFFPCRSTQSFGCERYGKSKRGISWSNGMGRSVSMDSR